MTASCVDYWINYPNPKVWRELIGRVGALARHLCGPELYTLILPVKMTPPLAGCWQWWLISVHHWDCLPCDPSLCYSLSWLVITIKAGMFFNLLHSEIVGFSVLLNIYFVGLHCHNSCFLLAMHVIIWASHKAVERQTGPIFPDSFSQFIIPFQYSFYSFLLLYFFWLVGLWVIPIVKEIWDLVYMWNIHNLSVH